MTDEEYLLKYQEKYGKLDNKGKEYVLKCKKEADNMTNEETKNFLYNIEHFFDNTVVKKSYDGID